MSRLTVITLLVATPALARQDAPATKPAEVTLAVHAVRMTRATSPELQKQFRGRMQSEQPVAWMQLMMTFPADAAVLPLTHNAVAIDTFVDDTYQSLIGTGREGGGGGNYPSQSFVSEDGRVVVFTVQGTRPPAEGAGRVFVRGALHARAARGEVTVKEAQLALRAGQSVNVGPYRTSVRSISSDQGQPMFHVGLGIEGDAGRIRKIRVLGPDDRVLSDGSREQRHVSPDPNQPSSFNLNLPAGTEQVTLEFSYVERAEPITVPFEVQVDVGQTKAGPVRVGGERGEGRGDRAWPPPPPGRADFQPRRAALDPTTLPADQQRPKLERVSADVFALAVGKPAPGEVEGVQWNNPPAPALRASGYTILRLMLSTPGTRILAVPPGEVRVTRFEDDKGGKIDAQPLAPRNAGSYPHAASTSPSGEQALVNVVMSAAPRGGATRCTLAGTVSARVGRGERQDQTEPLPLVKGQTFKLGPFEGRFGDVRQSPPASPDTPGGHAFEVYIELSGPIEKGYALELVDAQAPTGPPVTNFVFYRGESQRPDGVTTMAVPFALRTVPNDRVIVRVRHFESIETVQIPFDVTTALGL